MAPALNTSCYLGLQNNKLQFKEDWDSPNDFLKRIPLVFANNKVYKDDKITPFPVTRLAWPGQLVVLLEVVLELIQFVSLKKMRMQS